MGTQPEQTVEQRASADAPCASVVDTVEQATGVDSAALDPLYAAVEPSLLRSLCESRPTVSGHVTFTWADCDVTVHADRRVLVRPHAVDEGSE